MSAAPPAPGVPAGRWARIDAAVALFERGLIVALLALMAVAVFLDAIHRLFAADEGRLERLVVALTPAAFEGAARRVLAPALLALLAFAVAYAAGRARQRALAPPGAAPRGPALLLAAALTAGLSLAVWLFVRAVPSGLVWSQQMALCFMLWIALAGASLGAREHAHIAFELAGVIWPHRLRRPVERVARVLAAAFTLFLALLAAAHAREHYLEWAGSGGAAGLFEAWRVPRFVIFGFLPFPLLVTGLRFLGHGVRRDEPLPEDRR
jgi:TRAP-type C4-dicarboxylate transport system permease small subunit